MIKRFLVIGLTASILLTSVPINMYAAEFDIIEESTEKSTEEPTEEVIENGSVNFFTEVDGSEKSLIQEKITMSQVETVEEDSILIETGVEFGRTQYLGDMYEITNPRLVYGKNIGTTLLADAKNISGRDLDFVRVNIYIYTSDGGVLQAFMGVFSPTKAGETTGLNASITEDWRNAGIVKYSLENIDTGEVSTVDKDEVIIDSEKLYFGDHTYQYFEGGISWYDAKKKCEEMGGYLLVVSSEEEQKAINIYVEELEQLGKVTKQNIWLGSTIENNVLDWVAEKENTFTNWAQGEPNNVFGMQDCVMMYTSLSVNGSLGYWNDENGNGRNWDGFTVDKFGYICEWGNEDEELDNQDRTIGVFTTEKSLCVAPNDSLWLAFGIIENNKFDSEWKKFAIVISDPTIVDLSDYQETEYGYSIEVIGKKQGATNLVITDTVSGISETIRITVRDKYIQTQSFDINNMPSFYPNTTEQESKIQTNIYNLNGLYVNNYSAVRNNNTNKYTINFDVYNSKYYYGAIDIYDENGNWIDYEEIKNFSDITSVWETGEQAFYLITDIFEHKILTYEQKSFSEYTHISFELPENGYYTISNNVATSPGTYFANAFAILFDSATTALDLTMSDSMQTSAFEGFMDGNKETLMERMVDVLIDNVEENEEIQKVFLGTLESSIRKVTENVAKAEWNFIVSESNNMFSSIVTLAEDMLNSFKIDWREQFSNVVGIGESIFTKLSGPAGIALSGCFSVNEDSSKLLMAVEMATSTDSTYVTVYSNVEEGYINQNGVIIDTSGKIDSDAVLQVFRVSNDDSVDDIFDEDDPNERYELYNICFVKNDQLVQPNGQVTVYVPIPTGMNENTCKIYRQEDDGSWTILDAHIEGKYLVFETNHFSLYAIVGENKSIQVESLPINIIYNNGDVLNDEGLVINVGGTLITEGFICMPTVLSQCGTQRIIVKYGSSSTDFEVTVTHVGGTADCKQKAICTACGKEYGEYRTHDYSEKIDEVFPTCESEGKRTYYKCEVCNALFDENMIEVTEDKLVVPALKHSNIQIRNAIAATIDKEGYSGDVWCVDCNTIIEKGVVIEQLKHNHVMTCHEEIKATCVKTGSVRCWTCSNNKCDGIYFANELGSEILTSIVIPKNTNNHVGKIKVENTKEATFEEDGYSGDKICIGCGEIVERGKIIPRCIMNYPNNNIEQPDLILKLDLIPNLENESKSISMIETKMPETEVSEAETTMENEVKESAIKDQASNDEKDESMKVIWYVICLIIVVGGSIGIFLLLKKRNNN